jgi:hypothetical protein
MESPGTKRAALDESTNQELDSPAQRQKVVDAGADPRGPPPPPPPKGKGKSTNAAGKGGKAAAKGGKGKGKGPPPPPGMRPPPPPGGPSASGPRPPQPMKAVAWSKLSVNKIPGSVWASKCDAKVKIDYALLDMFFADHEAIKKAAGEGTAPTEKSKKPSDERLKFLDGKRSQNVAIVSSSVKLTNSELRRALFMDPQALAKLSSEIVERLLTMCPCVPVDSLPIRTPPPQPDPPPPLAAFPQFAV